MKRRPKANSRKSPARRVELFLRSAPEWIAGDRMEVPASLSGGRECGGCRECCVTPAIRPTDLEGYHGPVGPKKACVECPHLASSGCSVYDRRPAVCAEFFCLYRVGVFDERPDETGVTWAFAGNDDTAWHEGPGIRVRGQCRDVDAALLDEVVRRQIRDLLRASRAAPALRLKALTLVSPDHQFILPLGSAFNGIAGIAPRQPGGDPFQPQADTANIVTFRPAWLAVSAKPGPSSL